MRPRRLRFEYFDDRGNRVVVSVEGSLDTGSLVRYAQVWGEISGASPAGEPSPEPSVVRNIVHVVSSTAGEWFTSHDVKRMYQERCGQPASLSTVSTYLSRLYDRGLLTRERRGKGFRYRLQTPVPGQDVG